MMMKKEKPLDEKLIDKFRAELTKNILYFINTR